MKKLEIPIGYKTSFSTNDAGRIGSLNGSKQSNMKPATLNLIKQIVGNNLELIFGEKDVLNRMLIA